MSKQDFQKMINEITDSEEFRKLLQKHYENIAIYGEATIEFNEETCGFCSVPCRTDWCPTKDNK